MSGSILNLTGANLTLEDIEEVARFFKHVQLSDMALGNINKGRAVLEKKANEEVSHYSINTGFGDLCNVRIPMKDMKKLQSNLLISHACGVGPLLSEEYVRGSILIRINTLIQGNSGIRAEVINLLIEFLNKGICPCVPEQGSVGSSGDLAPLAHMALPIIGEGEVLWKGKKVAAKEALKEAGLEPIELAYKEGLALINGTSVMTSIGALTVLDAQRLVRMADISGTMSLEAMKGSNNFTHPGIHKIRPHKGQGLSAQNIRTLLEGSEIVESHKDCDKVQDPYSLRCMPQVHGASRDAIEYARDVIEIESNSVTDNPLIIGDEIVSGGNFHGQPVALAMDFLGIAIAEIANISERRVSRTINSRYSELPPFLTENSGLNSGFMIPQYTAASLVSENKCLAHPASVDSIPTCAGQEDHVSMGTIASRQAREILKNSWIVIAIELMASAQGLDLRLPLTPSKAIANVWKTIRNEVGKLEEDRQMSGDLEKIVKLMKDGAIISAAEKFVKIV